MYISEKQILLNDGRTAVLSAPAPEDAAALLRCFKTCVAETPFLLNTPEEVTFTVDQERSFIENLLRSDSEYMVVCLVDGAIAGNCNLSRNPHLKGLHRATIGISVRQKYWGLGIGTALLHRLVKIGKDMGLEQLELEVVSGNVRAKALYEKIGFQTVGCIPNAVHLSDGTVFDKFIMVLPL